VSGHKEVWDNAPHLNWATLAGVGGTLVFLMGTRQLQNNMQRLMNYGLPADHSYRLDPLGHPAKNRKC
jgi:siroheme synthase